MKKSKLNLANLPTPIEYLGNTSKVTGIDLYVKRDDYTGIEISGNKIRKLEYAIKEAMDQKCDVLITCGGIQSNHARATVAAARKLGLGVHLVLRGSDPEQVEGNLFINTLMGVQITWLNDDEFKNHKSVMETLKIKYAENGQKAYLIPIGASNGIGNFGYINAYEEILEQEKQMNIKFDAIVCTVGSGGTYSGLFLGNRIYGNHHRIIGISISSKAEVFKKEIYDILDESLTYPDLSKVNKTWTLDDIEIIDGYEGKGYAIPSDEDLYFIREMAIREGILFDPVYTGKAFRGLIDLIDKKTFPQFKRILFIHTGGLFGTFAFKEAFAIK